jgi:uncharacterized metal-binding protein YceD (DUF177 family)
MEQGHQQKGRSMSIDLPISHPIRMADVTGRRARDFDLRPDAAQLALMAPLLEVTRLADVALTGRLVPQGKADVSLQARLVAVVEQPCVVTLAPVVSRIDVAVARTYVAGMAEPTEDEMEMPADDTLEPLPQVLDLGAVLIEALALALPDYPRAEGAEMGEAVFAAPGVAALRTEDIRPFAALAALKKGQDDAG